MLRKYIFNILLLVALLISCKGSKVVESNAKEKSFNGEISFSVKTLIKNEERFDKELKLYIAEQDSLFRVKNATDTIWHSFTTPSLRLFLDPRENPSANNTYYRPSHYNYKYSDTLIQYEFGYGRSKFKVKIDPKTQDYRKYDIRTNKTIETKKYKYFTSDKPYKEIVYRDSLKMIHGFNCFKVIIIEDDLDANVIGNKIYKEMYVTRDIISLYHPVQVRKELLEKYYPLEIKIHSDFLSDKITYFKVDFIAEND